MPALTKSQVRKAGRTMRKYLQGDAEYRQEHAREVEPALAVIAAFRAEHSVPLAAANMGLRSMLNTEGCPIEVSQRLKRMPTILDKLVREPTLPLSSMQDIGGVRAVLDSEAQVRAIEARIKRRRPPTGYADYITSPRQSGYRGVHIIVEYGSANRQIEIQLRTQVMHEWALTVERLGGNAGENFKQDGDTPVQRFMAVVSEAMALEERGIEPSAELLATLKELRLSALGR